jgi:SOS-response transcriptional repressor LexA
MHKRVALKVNKNIRFGQNKPMNMGPEFHRLLQSHLERLVPPKKFYDIHKSTDIPTSEFSRWKSGRQGPSDTILRKIASIGWLDLSFEELLALRLKAKYGTESLEKQPFEGFYKIPLLGIVSAGELCSLETMDEIQEYIAFYNIKTVSSDMFALRVKGDSMEPAIPDGATLLCRPTDTIQNKGTYVIETIDGEATVKIIRYTEGAAQLIPYNPAYAPIPLEGVQIRRIYQVLQLNLDLEGRIL